MILNVWKEIVLDDSKNTKQGIDWDPQVWRIVEKAMKAMSWESHQKRLNKTRSFAWSMETFDQEI